MATNLSSGLKKNYKLLLIIAIIIIAIILTVLSANIISKDNIKTSHQLALETGELFKPYNDPEWIEFSDLSCENGFCLPRGEIKRENVGLLGWRTLAFSSLYKISSDKKWKRLAKESIELMEKKFGYPYYDTSSRFSMGHNITQLDSAREILDDPKINELIFLGGNDLTYRLQYESGNIYPETYAVPMIIGVAARNLARFSKILSSQKYRDGILDFAKKASHDTLIPIFNPEELIDLQNLSLATAEKMSSQFNVNINNTSSNKETPQDYCWGALARFEIYKTKNDQKSISNEVKPFIEIAYKLIGKSRYTAISSVLPCLELAVDYCDTNKELCVLRDDISTYLVSNFYDYKDKRNCSDSTGGFLSLNPMNDSCKAQGKFYPDLAHSIYSFSSFYKEFNL